MKLFENSKSNRLQKWLPALPYILIILGWIAFSHIRHLDNPDDKIAPTIAQIGKAFYRTAFEQDREGDYRLWVDTWATGRRFIISTLLLFLGVIYGLHLRANRLLDRTMTNFTIAGDKVLAIAILAILFVALGIGENTKIALCLIGILPTIALDTYKRVESVPQELLVKGATLGASNSEVNYRIILPLIFPRVLDTIRLNFKALGTYLIAAEAIAASEGLGYRIFIVRKYMAMDIILAYVLWLTLLLFLADKGIQFFIRKHYPWLDKE